MRTALLLIFLLSGIIAEAQTVLWEEDFEGESNDATTGTAGGAIGGTWSVTSLPPGGAGSFSRQNYLFQNRFTVNGTGNGEGVWSSGLINISSAPEVSIEMSLVEFLSSDSQDYLRVYYKLDGGPETLFASIQGGGGVELTSNASVILAGNTLEIIMRGRENSPAQWVWIVFIPVLLETVLQFDDVSLVQINTLYSRANGNWNNGNTWSTSRNGPACGCTPNAATHVIIEDIVNMNADGDVVNVTIESGGSLRYTGNNDLRIHRGGDINVQSGGNINRNGNNAARIEFTWAGVTNNVTINGNSSIAVVNIPAAATVNFSGSANLAVSDDILISAAAAVNFGGTGNVSITDDVLISAAAAVSFSGTGNFTIGDDMIVTAAATLNNNKTGGALTVDDDLSFDTDNATFNNNYLLSVNDLVSGNGDNGNTLRNNAGATFDVVTIAPGNGNLTIENYGTINQSGNFTNGSLDNGSSFNNRSTGTWNFSMVGGTNDGDINSVLNCSEAGNTFNFNGAGNQTVFNTQYHHLTISTSGTKTLSAATDINGNLTVRNSATLDADDRNISLGGNWTVLNTASFTQGTATITFDGSSNQSITNASGQTFSRLVIDKAGGDVVLNNNLIIADGGGTDLTLTRGNINSSTTALVTINNGATTTSGNVNSFINGPARKIGNTNFVFPTGKNGQFARIGINPSGGNASSQFTAEYFNTPHSNLTVDGSLAHVSHAEYWTLTRAVSAPTATVVLYWQDSFSDISNLTDLRVARFTGALWTTAGNSARTGTPAGPGTITSTSMSSFQAFTFASLSGVNILPVEMLYFKATLNNDKVELTWETASELNNDYFTIERAVNAEKFIPVNKVKGKGNSREKSKYSFTDHKPFYGRSYYRLKQTDFDGTVTYSDITFIDYVGPAFPTLSVYPNPAIGKNVTIELEGFEEEGIVPVMILDTNGRRLYETSVNVPGKSAVITTLNLRLPEGIYIIRAGSTKYLTKRLVIE